MLHAVSWEAFLRIIFILTVLYYAVIITRFYPKDIKSWFRRFSR